MKKIVLGLVGTLALTACGGNGDSGSNNGNGVYSGNYSGTMSYQGSSILSFYATINQNNSPNNGDFTGSASLGGTSLTSTLAGNINSGQLTLTDPPNAYNTGVAKCNGKWANGNRYDGVCVLTNAGTSFSNVVFTLARK